MKNSIIGSLLLIFTILISFAVFAGHIFDANPVAKTQSDGRKLDRLFSDMGVYKLTESTEPLEIRLPDLNGNTVSLSDFRGKIVFLNFWTTWCPTCRIEMPSMQKLHQKFAGKDLAMVTINLQESASEVKKFFKKFKLTFTALLDTTGEVGVRIGIRAIPTTFILDKTGRIIGQVMGPRQWDRKEAIALFEFLSEFF